MAAARCAAVDGPPARLTPSQGSPDKFCLNAAHEPHMVGLIETLLRARRGTFIDIGVNLGQTLVKVLGVDRERDYVGFEPQIACCFHVDQFIRRNAVAHARVIPVALGAADGWLTLYAGGDIDEMASLDATGLRATAATPRSIRRWHRPTASVRSS